MFNAQELINSEIRTILIGSAQRLHYEHTWSGLLLACETHRVTASHAIHKYFSRGLSITINTIYIFEDIN